MAENKESQAVSDKRSFLYELTRFVSTVLFHTLMPVKFHGREKLDREPPFILIANHRHALDPLAMVQKDAIIASDVGVSKRPITFLLSGALFVMGLN